MSEYQKKYLEIFKGSSIVIAGTIINYGLNYLYKIFSGRYLGPNGLGTLAIGVSVMAIFANFSTLGFSEGIARFIPFYVQKEDYPGIKGILIFAFPTIFILSIILSTIILLHSDWLSYFIFKQSETSHIIKLFSLIIPLQAIYFFMLGIFRGLKRMGDITVANDIILWTTKICLVFLLILLKLPVEYYVTIFFTATAFAMWFLIIKIRKTELVKKIAKIPGTKEVRKKFLRFSLPLILSNFFTILRKRTDILIVGIFLPISDVGYYYAALPFAIILTILLFSINRIIMPVASEAVSKNDTSKAIKLYKDFALLCFQLTLPAFLLIFFFSNEIILLFYGSNYAPAGDLLKILSIGYFINAITGSFGEYFKVFGTTNLNFYLSLVGGCLNVGLMILLVPAYGVKGAAISTSLVLVIMVLLGLLLAQIFLKINPFSKKYYAMIIITAALFLFFLNFFKGLIPLLKLSFFILFSLIYSIFIIKSNIGIIKSIIRKIQLGHSKSKTNC